MAYKFRDAFHKQSEVIIIKMRHYFYLFISFFFLSSCSQYIFSNISDEMLDYSNDITKIVIYDIDRSILFPNIHETTEIPLHSEEYIRRNGNRFIFYKSGLSAQCTRIALLLYNAKPININTKKNIVPKKEILGISWTKYSGCVIDIYDMNGNVKKTYIMQNGLDVFYEKGKEGIYYIMPRIILNKFTISRQEFLSEYKEVRSRNYSERQPK